MRVPHQKVVVGLRQHPEVHRLAVEVVQVRNWEVGEDAVGQHDLFAPIVAAEDVRDPKVLLREGAAHAVVGNDVHGVVRLQVVVGSHLFDRLVDGVVLLRGKHDVRNQVLGHDEAPEQEGSEKREDPRRHQ